MRIAAVQRKIRGRCGGVAVEQARASAREAKQVENIGCGVVEGWGAPQRVGQFMKRDAYQQVRIYVGRKVTATIVGGGVVSRYLTETGKLCLRIPNNDI